MSLIRMGEAERGLPVFAGHPRSNDALFLGEILGTRLCPQAWASPAFPGFLRKTGIAAYWDEVSAPAHCRKDEKGDYHRE